LDQLLNDRVTLQNVNQQNPIQLTLFD